MIDYYKALMKKRIDNTVKALDANNIKGYRISSREEMFEVLESFIAPNSTVGYGGSVSLEQAGVIDWLRWKKDIVLYDRERVDDPYECMRKCLTSDTFICSTNAISEDGWLYNIDGRGNRVASMIFGPKSVIVIAGMNKLVANLDEAKRRARAIAAPANAMRLDKDTPCAKSGSCIDCKSPERICSNFVAMGHQSERHRIKVLIVEENLGY